jgi:hypothetical protein
VAKSIKKTPRKRTEITGKSHRRRLTPDAVKSIQARLNPPTLQPSPVQVIYFPTCKGGRFVLPATGGRELTNEERELEESIRRALPKKNDELRATLASHQQWFDSVNQSVQPNAMPVNCLLVTRDDQRSDNPKTTQGEVVEFRGLFTFFNSIPSVESMNNLIRDLKIQYGCQLGSYCAFVPLNSHVNLLEKVEILPRNKEITDELDQPRNLDDQTIPADLSRTGREVINRQPTGTEGGSKGTSFSMTETQSSVRISNMPDDLPLPQHPVETKTDSSQTSVLDLLVKGATLAEIRKHVRDSIAPSPEKIATALNKWLAEQDPADRVERMTLSEKQGIAELLTLISDAMQQPLFWRGEECRIEAYGNPSYEPGYFRVRPPGVKAGFTKAHLSDLLKEAPFGFNWESSLHGASEVATDPTVASEGESKAGPSFSAKETRRKSQPSKKKPHR